MATIQEYKMTTINGVTFNMKTLDPVATHRNIPNEQPGSDESFINDMGYGGLVLRITGFETTLSKYDEVISEFMKTGAQTLVYRTGWQFSVYSTRLIPMLDIGIVDNWFPYELIMITSTPYRESITQTCLSKSITTNNQEWSESNILCDSILVDNWGFETWTAGDTSAPDNWNLTGASATILKWPTDAVEGSYSAKLGRVGTDCTLTSDQISDYAQYKGETVTFGVWILSNTVSGGIRISDGVSSTYTASNGNNVWTWLTVTRTIDANATTFTVNIEVNSVNASIWIDGAALVVGSTIVDSPTFAIDTSGSVDAVPDLQVTGAAASKNNNTDVDIYNTADSSVKCRISDNILFSAIHRINVDGTGTINFDDDFSTTKYTSTSTALSNVTIDDPNNELDIADDGYIYWKCDTKGPVTGIPTLTSQINITSGIPTIQISEDASTWYDITTAIIDDIDTIYELDSSSLSLKGLTLFYWRYDCVKAGAATCSIKSFELDVKIVTIDFEHPVISASGVSTFRCDQDAASGINAVICLIYRDRSWLA